jgi:hypothetical protein
VCTESVRLGDESGTPNEIAAARLVAAVCVREVHVLMKIERPAGRGSRRPEKTATFEGGSPIRSPRFSQIFRVELVGSDQAIAYGLTARGYAPLCQLCRRLIEAGFNPGQPVEAYRGNVLALRARSLRMAATLTVEDGRDGRPRLRPYRPPSVGVAGQSAPNVPRAPGQPPGKNKRSCAARAPVAAP